MLFPCFDYYSLIHFVAIYRFRAGAHSLNHFWSSTVSNAYDEFGRLYPALNALVDPDEGVKEIYRTSLSFRRQKDFCFAVLGGREKDILPAEDMYSSDMEILLRAIQPNGTGCRLSAYLLVGFELGHRPAMFLLCFPGHVRQHNNGRWRFEGLYDVKTNHRYHDYTLTQNVSDHITDFKRAEPLRDWAVANTCFHYDGVEHLDQEIYHYLERAGYPLFFFSSYSIRRGMINEMIANFILQGQTREQAVGTVRERIGWASAGDTAQDYISPIGMWCSSLIIMF